MAGHFFQNIIHHQSCDKVELPPTKIGLRGLIYELKGFSGNPQDVFANVQSQKLFKYLSHFKLLVVEELNHKDSVIGAGITKYNFDNIMGDPYELHLPSYLPIYPTDKIDLGDGKFSKQLKLCHRAVDGDSLADPAYVRMWVLFEVPKSLLVQAEDRDGHRMELEEKSFREVVRWMERRDHVEPFTVALDLKSKVNMKMKKNTETSGEIEMKEKAELESVE